MKHQCLQIFPCLLVLCVLHNACFVCIVYRGRSKTSKKQCLQVCLDQYRRNCSPWQLHDVFLFTSCVYFVFSHTIPPSPFSSCTVHAVSILVGCHFLPRVLSSVTYCCRAPPFVCLHMFAFVCIFFHLFACYFVLFIYLICLFVCICSSLSPLAQICPSLPLPPDTNLLLSPCANCYTSPSPPSHNFPLSHRANLPLFPSPPSHKFVPLSHHVNYLRSNPALVLT